ncbi:hypothetical protein GA0115254_109525 [Streptomyces sp. Ncost-T10-10d]|nr:hypothetical protein GA0115254_109525 [Streptomyces sp. Ncost-T10-10d]
MWHQWAERPPNHAIRLSPPQSYGPRGRHCLRPGYVIAQTRSANARRPVGCNGPADARPHSRHYEQGRQRSSRDGPGPCKRGAVLRTRGNRGCSRTSRHCVPRRPSRKNCPVSSRSPDSTEPSFHLGTSNTRTPECTQERLSIRCTQAVRVLAQAQRHVQGHVQRVHWSIDTGSQAAARCGRLGSHVRWAETPADTVLMGVRLCNPSAEHCLSLDPVRGGGLNAYKGTYGGPVNRRPLPDPPQAAHGDARDIRGPHRGQHGVRRPSEPRSRTRSVACRRRCQSHPLQCLP